MPTVQYSMLDDRRERDRRRAPFWMWAVCIAHCALLVTGCAKARAEAVPDGPPLSVPEPPARVLMPVEEPLPTAAVTPDAPPATAPRPPVRQPVRRPSGASTTADTEPRSEPTPPAAAAAPSGAAPTPTLRAAPSTAEATAERNVRDLLQRATRDLSRVDYGRLSDGGRTQYEQSKRFTEQAEQALKDRNFPFAATLADKAATLAAGLLGSR